MTTKPNRPLKEIRAEIAQLESDPQINSKPRKYAKLANLKQEVLSRNGNSRKYLRETNTAAGYGASETRKQQHERKQTSKGKAALEDLDGGKWQAHIQTKPGERFQVIEGGKWRSQLATNK